MLTGQKERTIGDPENRPHVWKHFKRFRWLCSCNDIIARCIRTLMQSSILTHLPSPLALPQYLCEESDPHSERFQFGFCPQRCSQTEVWRVLVPTGVPTCSNILQPFIEVQKHETDGIAVEMLQTDSTDSSVDYFGSIFLGPNSIALWLMSRVQLV